MRVTLREVALLALPILSNAVSLSDMTPRATDLPPMCEAVYTSQIPGCAPTDFQTQECSPGCISALYGLAHAISHACAGQTGQNLVVAFLAGVGPQAVCHNAQPGGENTGMPPSHTHPPPPHLSPTIGHSTTTAPKATTSGPLLVDTSSTMTQTIIPHPTKESSSAPSSQPPKTTTKTTPVAEHTATIPSPTASSETSSAAGSSQTNLNDHSGGGSPFDTAGNTGSASGVSISMASIIFTAAAAMLFSLR